MECQPWMGHYGKGLTISVLWPLSLRCLATEGDFFCLFSSMLLEIMDIRQLKTHLHVFKPKQFAYWNIFLEFVTCWHLLDREGQVKRVQERVVMAGRQRKRSWEGFGLCFVSSFTSSKYKVPQILTERWRTHSESHASTLVNVPLIFQPGLEPDMTLIWGRNLI